MRFAAQRFVRIVRDHGSDAVAFYGSGQLDSEATYLATKLFKGCLGTNNTDSNSRLCMASAVAGYTTSLGSDGPPTCYDDVDEADLILIIGSNMAEAHPVTFDRIRARRARDGGRPYLVVIDPRRTKTAESKIALAEAQALADVRAAAANAAVSAASTILSQSVKGSVADDLLAKGIAEVRAKLN